MTRSFAVHIDGGLDQPAVAKIDDALVVVDSNDLFGLQKRKRILR